MSAAEKKEKRTAEVYGCPLCGDPLCMGECQWEHPDDYPEPCSCRFCYCPNTTDSGEVCSNCRADAHQG